MAHWMVKVRTVDDELYVVDLDFNVTGPSLLRRLKLKYITVREDFILDFQHGHWGLQNAVKNEASKLPWVKYAEAYDPPPEPGEIID